MGAAVQGASILDPTSNTSAMGRLLGNKARKDALNALSTPPPPPPPPPDIGDILGNAAVEGDRKRLAALRGYGSTILTGPLGDATRPATSNKSILGG